MLPATRPCAAMRGHVRTACQESPCHGAGPLRVSRQPPALERKAQEARLGAAFRVTRGRPLRAAAPGARSSAPGTAMAGLGVTRRTLLGATSRYEVSYKVLGKFKEAGRKTRANAVPRGP